MPDGHHSRCKTCRSTSEREYREAKPLSERSDRQRGHNLKSKYGITSTEYDEMLAAQDGVCAVCRQPETRYDPRWRVTRRLAVDHCHTTGKVRGLLCFEHNSGLGKFADDPELLRAAAEYLERSRALRP